MILQPQSEIGKVRRFLNEHNLQITEENMVEEDGKFYPMMKVIHGKKEEYTICEYRLKRVYFNNFLNIRTVQVLPREWKN